ncbi:hypothetical protein [Scytonema hofmannii]|nr:hypothetical protein [Scytonema hofmannii]
MREFWILDFGFWILGWGLGIGEQVIPLVPLVTGHWSLVTDS